MTKKGEMLRSDDVMGLSKEKHNKIVLSKYYTQQKYFTTLHITGKKTLNIFHHSFWLSFESIFKAIIVVYIIIVMYKTVFTHYYYHNPVMGFCFTSLSITRSVYLFYCTPLQGVSITRHVSSVCYNLLLQVSYICLRCVQSKHSKSTISQKTELI